MKNFKFALGVLLSLAVVLAPVAVHAREINSNPAKQDAWSVHGGDPTCYAAGYVSGCEVAIDVTGNFLPTVTNAQDLGTSALQFRNVYAVKETVTGNQTTGTNGTGTLGTAGVAATVNTVLGLFSTPSVMLGTSGQNTGVNISTTIPVVASYELIISSGSNITLTSTPTISTTTLVGGTVGIPDGTYLVIGSTATQVITLQSNGTLSGSQLKLGAATRAITQYKDITLRFSSADSFWHEVAYSSDAN